MYLEATPEEHKPINDDTGQDQAEITKSDAKILFGREDLTVFYRTALNKFFELKMNKLSLPVVHEDRTELIICGIWKIVIYKGKSLDHVRVQKLDIEKMVWVDKPLSSFPDILLLPMGNSGIWRKLIISLLWNDLFPDLGYYSLKLFDDMEETKGKLGRSRVADIIISSIFRKLNPKMMGYAVKTMRKHLYEHVIDRSFFKVAMSINFRRLLLSNYLIYENNKEHVLRVYNEHRNLVSMLGYIDEELWGNPDLFSEKRWVDSTFRKSDDDEPEIWTATIQPATTMRNKLIEPFSDVTSYRWLLKAPHSVVQAIFTNGNLNNSARNLIAVLAKANQNLKYQPPVITYRHLFQIGMYPAPANGIDEQQWMDRYQRIIHLYLNHAGWLWKEQGYKTAKRYIKEHRHLIEVIDWFRHVGHEKYPVKNSTWLSLINKSNEWHVEVSAFKVKENRKWSQPFDEIIIDDISIKALSSTIDITKEGAQMKHCVATFDESCFMGSYRVFSLTDEKGMRSTLGTHFNGQTYKLHQHYGKYNSAVSKKFKSVATKLLKQLNKADTEKKHAK